MRILIVTMPFIGHREPARVFCARLKRELPEHETLHYEAPAPDALAPADLATWYARFREVGTTPMHSMGLALTAAEFGADVMLADPAAFGALPVARALQLPIGMLGNLPVLYVDERPVLQFTIPELELEPYRSSSRVTYVGPMAELAPPAQAFPPHWQLPRVHVTQGTLVTDRDVLLRPMYAVGDDYQLTHDHWPDVRANHRALFRHLDLLVTTGGYGAVSRALLAGVPMLVTGTTEDKPAVGERVEKAGIGLYRPTRDPLELRDACETILADATMRARAAELALRCRRVGGHFAPRVTRYLEAVRASVPLSLPDDVEVRQRTLAARARAVFGAPFGALRGWLGR